jgi:hypothetical protein
VDALGLQRPEVVQARGRSGVPLKGDQCHRRSPRSVRLPAFASLRRGSP